MKKITGLLLLAIVVTFSACKKNGESAVGPSIVGKYKDLGSKGSITVNILGQTSTESLDEAPTADIYEFKADGTVISKFGEITFTKYKVAGSLITFSGTENGKSFEFVYNYTLNGKILTLSMDKELFKKNVLSYGSTGADNDFADLKDFLEFFTAVNLTSTLEKI
jgi:hypothetical protein